MMSDTVTAAVRDLQKRAMRTTDSYELDRIERAMDEILRHPEDDHVPAKHLTRSALGHAYETLKRRKEIAPRTEVYTEYDEPGYVEQGFHDAEILECIRVEPTFKQPDRAILLALALGADAEILAHPCGMSIPRMRERISRVRHSARACRAAWELVA